MKSKNYRNKIRRWYYFFDIIFLIFIILTYIKKQYIYSALSVIALGSVIYSQHIVKKTLEHLENEDE